MDLPPFNEALKDGAALRSWNGDLTLEQREIGHLHLPSGRVVACDPFMVYEPEPLDWTARPGRYPVSLSIAHFGSGDGADQRVALAVVRFSDADPVAWRLAAPEGADPDDLPEGEVYGYGVDSGTGGFLSAEAAEELETRNDAFFDKMVEVMEETYVHTWSWAEVVLDPEAELNLVAFSSGGGDGFYTSFWGLDAEGEVACLLTDFGLLGEDEEPE